MYTFLHACMQKRTRARTHTHVHTCARARTHTQEDERLRLKNPAISVPADTTSGMRTIYNPLVQSILEKTKANLDEPIAKWVTQSGVELTVDDPIMATQKQVAIHYSA